MSCADPVYWLCNPLDPDYVRVLRNVGLGRQRFDVDRLEVAYLIAIACVEADLEGRVLKITEKGRDAVAYFKD